MKKILYLLVFVSIITSCSNEKPLELNVMTFNIRLDSPVDSSNNWLYRKNNATEMITSYNVDILGAQEVLANQLNDLKTLLPQYNAIGVAREDGKIKGEYCPFLYKKDRFSELESGNFWLSETPDAAGSLGWDAECVRIATWAILKDKETGRQIFAMNTHLDHMGTAARNEGGKLLIKKAAELSKGLPIILTGDFNDIAESETIKNLTDSAQIDHLADSKHIAENISGTDWTFHDFGRLNENERPLLDYIFVSKGIDVISYEVLPESSKDTFVSDHKPVLVKISIK